MNRSSLAINTRYGCELDEVKSGDPQGKLVLLLHGHPENCLFLFPEAGLPASLGIRLITIDHPGHGMIPCLQELELRTDFANNLIVERVINSTPLMQWTEIVQVVE